MKLHEVEPSNIPSYHERRIKNIEKDE